MRDTHFSVFSSRPPTREMANKHLHKICFLNRESQMRRRETSGKMADADLHDVEIEI